MKLTSSVQRSMVQVGLIPGARSNNTEAVKARVAVAVSWNGMVFAFPSTSKLGAAQHAVKFLAFASKTLDGTPESLEVEGQSSDVRSSLRSVEKCKEVKSYNRQRDFRFRQCQQA
ncbi:hypothetical protein M011DRAFT_30483 [Sporormia fimetaria CBS 119925]|uniref:Uncharacterized protein n=1 Tax=Sporormia fimetaria CBS 119925 TaxID=1340428 RepID=A0A6A6VE83_9PLEO|nr:hypothetical protein M011DRAFT_30483 [Sporormia fimetaria CBS 119925]